MTSNARFKVTFICLIFIGMRPTSTAAALLQPEFRTRIAPNGYSVVTSGRLLALFSVPSLRPLRLCGGIFPGVGIPAQSSGYGPEVKSFLEYIRHEEVELDFQIKHAEIQRKDYERSMNRLEVNKETVLARVRRTGQDMVPNYNVLAASEVGDILPNGVADLKGHKAGDLVDAKWKYVGAAFRGEKFYIFERIKPN
jgi:hypothetical protein